MGKSQKNAKASRDKKRKPSNYFTKIRQEILARFRPVERVETINFTEAEKILRSKLTPMEQVFNPEFERRMRSEYGSRVTPFEQKVNDPYRRAQPWDMNRFDNGRRDMADWTAKEALNDRLQNFFRGADRNSAPMRVMSIMKTPDEEPKPEPQQAKGASARGDLKPELQAASAQKPEEPRIPTRLKTNLNPLKQEGQVVLQNPVVTTGVKGSRNEVAVEMKREFRGLGTESNAKYGMKEACLQLNLRQKITDRVSLHLDHANYTSSKRGPTGEKTRETARVTYSLSF